MVNISIDVTDLGGEARPGDKVVFWRPRMGGSATHAGRVISTAPVTVFLADGKATVSDVEPGEMTVLLQCRGVESQGPVTVGVPDGDHTVTLRALLESQFEYAPPIVSAVQEAASNASASEEAAIRAQVRSERAADRADAKVDDAINNGANLIRNEVKQDADRAVSARQAATQSESNAAASENASASSASNAAASESAAKQSEDNAGDFAAVATTAATEAVDAMSSVSDIIGAKYATQEYVDGKAWQKGLLYTTNLDEVLTPGVYAQPNSNWATSANGYPEQTRGTLTVSSWDTADPGRVYQVFTATYFNRVWMRERVNGAWAKWFNFHSASFQVNGDLNYQDLNNVLSPGVYRQPLSARATVARNYPQATRGVLTVHRWGDESQVSQTYQATFRGDVYTREHSATGWEDWMRIAGDTSTSGNGSQLNHRRDAMKQASRMRRGGVIGTNGATPVSLSFDHGYVNFRDKVLPHLRRLGLPSTSAFNQGQLGSGENEGISWPQLQEYGLNYGVEFAHHGYSHTDIADASTNVERITNALTSSIDLVKTQMPEVVADAFILPGVGGTNYDGFNGGAEPESWWTHPAGRALMQHFPVVSAKRRGVAVPLMRGEDLSFGSDRLGWDTANGADTLKSHIQSLAGTTMGVKCFMHPSQIGLAGKISEAKLVETLEWLAAERDAGRIEVLTVSGFAYADVTSNARMNIAPSWTGDQAVISLSPMLDYLAGAQVLVETTADTSGTLTISATSDTGGLDASVTHTATAGRRYRLAFSIPKSAKTITITAPGNLRSARIV